MGLLKRGSLNNPQIDKSSGFICNENTEPGFGHQSSAQILVPFDPWQCDLGKSDGIFEVG